MRISGQIIGAPVTTATRRSVIFSSDGFDARAHVLRERVEIVVGDEAVGEGRAGGAGGERTEEVAAIASRADSARLTAGFIARPFR